MDKEALINKAVKAVEKVEDAVNQDDRVNKIAVAKLWFELLSLTHTPARTND